jgi:hypothetical protein
MDLWKNHWQKPSDLLYNKPDSGKMPVNYVGFNENGTPTATIDFTKASEAAVQAVVHIKTKIPAKQMSNSLTTQQR